MGTFTPESFNKAPSDGRVKGPGTVDQMKNLGLNRDEDSKGKPESKGADSSRIRFT